MEIKVIYKDGTARVLVRMNDSAEWIDLEKFVGLNHPDKKIGAVEVFSEYSHATIFVQFECHLDDDGDYLGNYDNLLPNLRVSNGEDTEPPAVE